MTISSIALQGILLLHVILKTVSQFPMPFPFPGGSPQMMPGPPQMMQGPSPMMLGGPHPMMPSMGPFPPLPPQLIPGGVHYPMQHKMPVVVMPYYSKSADKVQKKNKRRKKRPRKVYFDDDSSCEDEDSSSSTSDEFNFRTKPKSTRRQVLTPVVSYVTKDGYVVYQKKIKKDKAKDWLDMNKRGMDSNERDGREDDRERLLKKLKKLKFSQKHHHH